MGSSVVVVVSERKRLRQLREGLSQLTPAPERLVAIGQGETDIAEIPELNPVLARRLRQRRMATWLIPFGFFAGLTFTFITDLDTFAFAGSWGSHLIGGLLGLGSGWMGSFAAAASVSSESDDRVRALRNRFEEGNWLLLVEMPNGIEMPWTRLQEAKPKAVVRLNES
ncbi:MAG: hypothetical protein FJ056_02720 [Cyanobacteria bacterium M_surface_10_m2_179]|nr:hypothetical protein [Cyanobacteria bacterium M_surface_10_m2_179]